MVDLLKSKVDALKEAGTNKLAYGSYTEALELFSAANELLPDGDVQKLQIQGELVAVYLKLRRAKECADCCRATLDANASNVQARVNLALAEAGAGNLKGALQVFDAAPIPHGSFNSIRTKLEVAQRDLAVADELLEAGEHRRALEMFCALEDTLFDCPSLVAQMGRCYVALGDFNRVLHISATLLRRDTSDVAAYLLRAEAQFQATKEHIDVEEWDKGAESAVKTVRQALSLDPEHKAAARLRRRLRSNMDMVREVRSAMKANQHARAEDLLTGALEAKQEPATPSSASASGRFAARCHTERGRARLQRGNLEGCISDCQTARRLDDRITAAHVIEAQALQKQERWDDAVTVLEALHEWNKDNDIFWKVEWAKFEVRRVRRPNYYEILGLELKANFAEVKKAYLRRSAEYHPDKRRRQQPDLDQTEIESQFKMVAEAFEFLGDSAKRELYDKGYDAQGIREVLAVRKRVAGQAPCSQCGEDESGKLGADNKWYCLSCWDSYYRDMPQESPKRDLEARDMETCGTPASASVSRSMGTADVERQKVPSWPAGESLPSFQDIEQMSVADLKGVLRKMQVDAAGCLTKEDLRSTICRHLEALRSTQGNFDARPSHPGPPVSAAPGGTMPESSSPSRSAAGGPQADCLPADGSAKIQGSGGVADVEPASPSTALPSKAAPRRGPPPSLPGQPDWSFSIAASMAGNAAKPSAGWQPQSACAPSGNCLDPAAARPERPDAKVLLPGAGRGGSSGAPSPRSAALLEAKSWTPPPLLDVPVEFEYVD